ncbi:MAG: hypothetical protein P8100_13510 [bacterium]
METRTIVPAVILLTVLLFASISLLQAQDRLPVFVGLQPGYTAEPFYSENELDINVVPLLAQFPVSKRVDLRAVTLVNYQIGGEENGISDIGMQIVLPVFFKKKEKTRSLSGGFYAGPVVGIGRNLLNDHNTLILAVEPGYQFPAKKSFSIALGLQLGATYFDYFNQANVWRNHFGFKVNIGFWANKSK